MEVNVTPSTRVGNNTIAYQGEVVCVIAFRVSEPTITSDGEFTFKEITMIGTYENLDSYTGAVVYENRKDYTITEIE